MRLMSSSPLAAPIGLALGPLILKPLYWIGIVRGGRLDSADGVEVVDGEIDERGVDHAHVDHVHAGAADAVDERLGQRRANAAACRGRRPCVSSSFTRSAGVLCRLRLRNCAVAWPTFHAASSFRDWDRWPERRTL